MPHLAFWAFKCYKVHSKQYTKCCHQSIKYLEIYKKTQFDINLIHIRIAYQNWEISELSGKRSYFLNKLIIVTRLEIVHMSWTRVSFTQKSSATLKIIKKKIKTVKYYTTLQSIGDPIFPRVLPNTANLIYIWGRKSLVLQKI